MAIGNIHGQKSGVQSVDKVMPTPDGNIPLNAVTYLGEAQTGTIDARARKIINVWGGEGPNDAANMENVRQIVKYFIHESWVAVTINVPNAGWESSNEQSVACNGVTATNDIIVTPDPGYYDVYHESGVRVIAQSLNAVRFKFVGSKPGNLKVNVLIRKELV